MLYLEGAIFLEEVIYFNWRRGYISVGGGLLQLELGVHVNRRRGSTSAGGGGASMYKGPKFSWRRDQEQGPRGGVVGSSLVIIHSHIMTGSRIGMNHIQFKILNNTYCNINLIVDQLQMDFNGLSPANTDKIKHYCAKPSVRLQAIQPSACSVMVLCKPCTS